MDAVLTEVAKWYVAHAGATLSLIFVLSLSLVTNWYHYLLTRYLKEQLPRKGNEGATEKRTAMGEELIALIKLASCLILRFPGLPRNPIRATSRNVLLVEDEKAIHYLKEGLEEKLPQTQIHLANNGEEALAQILRQQFDLIITDLVMPQMDGFELIRKLAANWPDIPVLIISAYAEGSVDVAAKIGMLPSTCEFLAKPFILENVVAAIRRLTCGKRRRKTTDSIAV